MRRLTCCPESGCGSSRAVSWGRPVPWPVYAALSPSPVRIQTRRKQEEEEERQSRAWVEEGAELPVDRVEVEEGEGLQGEVGEGAELLVDRVGAGRQGEVEEGAELLVDRVEVEEGAVLLVDRVGAGLQGEAEEGAGLQGEVEEGAGHMQVQVRVGQEEGRSYQVEEAVLDPHPNSCWWSPGPVFWAGWSWSSALVWLRHSRGFWWRSRGRSGRTRCGSFWAAGRLRWRRRRPSARRAPGRCYTPASAASLRWATPDETRPPHARLEPGRAAARNLPGDTHNNNKYYQYTTDYKHIRVITVTKTTVK